ncbi:DUF305 domain-containing protein [Streptomyces sp. NPDC052610]|uniref:DUF305 domain-containing protein n=1 Tax=Streptomyces sp. NPDC052610 TaxID=3154952 RepID=UPI0034124D84
MTAFTRTKYRTSATRLAAAAAAVSAGVLLLTACGGDGDGNQGGNEAGTSGFNDADVLFAQQMIPHHEQALEMARLVDGRAGDEEIKDIAGKIEQAQDPEIRTLKGWLKSWKQPTAAESASGMNHGSHGGDGGHESAGMMSDADMAELKGLKGAAFDRAFAEMMIEHHNGAVAMAEDERRDGRNGEAKGMADDIVESQSAEIERLQGVLDRL